MTKLSILSVQNGRGGFSYRGAGGGKASQGDTIGKAVDALLAQMPEDTGGLLIVVQPPRPDQLFGIAQQQRKAELMQKLIQNTGNSKDGGGVLTSEEQAELNALMEVELYAAAEQAALHVS